MAVVDCRSLIEFLRTFEQQQRSRSASSPATPRNKKTNYLSPLSHPFCDHSAFAAVDAAVLLLALVALGVLAFPSFNFLLRQAAELIPCALDLLAYFLHRTPVAYALCLAFACAAGAAGAAAWEFVAHPSRKCGSPYCRGLKKAVEFDIQLESEECVRCLPPLLRDAAGAKPLQLGCDREELEAELKKMAPLNGRSVLIFRAPCGCPTGRMEVWGPKKSRRIKK